MGDLELQLGHQAWLPGSEGDVLSRQHTSWHLRGLPQARDGGPAGAPRLRHCPVTAIPWHSHLISTARHQRRTWGPGPPASADGDY